MEVSEVEKNLIDAYPAYVAIIDRDGEMMRANQAWKTISNESNEFFGSNCSYGNYFNYLANAAESGYDYALKIILGMRQVIEGDDDFNITYPVSRSEGKNWFKFTIRPANECRNAFLIIHEDVTKLIKATQAMRQSKEQYRQQFLQSSMSIIIGTPDGQILDCNPAGLALLGYSHEEFIRLHRNDVLDITDPLSIEAVSKRSKKGEFNGELVMIAKDNRRIPVELTSKIYRNENGDLRSLTMFKDISARHDAEEKLDTEKRFTDTALDSLPGLFVLLDEDSQLIRFNKGFTDELGYNEPEDLTKNIFDIIKQSDHEVISKALENVKKHGSGEEQAVLLDKNGNERIYKFRAKRFESKDSQYIAATGIDITDNVETEREKELTFELMVQLFNNSPIGIILSNADNKAERINRKFLEMFGIKKSDILGKHVDEILAPEHLKEEADEITRQVFTGKAIRKETIRMHSSGSEIPVLLGTVPVKMNGEVVAAYGIYIDISERIELENRINELFVREKRTRKEVEKSKIKLEEMFKQSPTAIALLEGPEFIFTMANSAYFELIGGRELIGERFSESLPELEDQNIIQILNDVYHSGKPYIAKEESIHIINKQGEISEHFLNYTCKPMFDNSDQVYGIFIEAVDVTELVNSRNNLQNSLKEKEILLQEVHHRVKNNLAVITGLMDLQMMDTQDDNLNPKLREVQSRIFSIAQIHEAIYQQEDVMRVKFDEYLVNMIASWKQNSDRESVELNLELENVNLNLNQAVSCGLLTNELMNLVDLSYSGESSKVNITLKEASGLVEIGVENSKFGISDRQDIERAEKFNLKIIQVLLNQLSASYQFENGDTKKLVIRFKKADVKGSSSSFI
jgi:PAS domain S-box-containing protein